MTSPREAVSILTAAALVVAPVGGVAATYTTGYAEDGDGHTTKDNRGHDIPSQLRRGASRWVDARVRPFISPASMYMAANAGPVR